MAGDRVSYDKMPAGVADRFLDRYHAVVTSTAAFYTRKFGNILPADEVANELWVYLFRRWEWVEELVEERGEKRAEGKLRLRLGDVARGLLQDEKLRMIGATKDDIAWYSPAMLTQILPRALDGYEGWAGGAPPAADGEQRRKSRPDEHGTFLAVLVDVRDGFMRLEDEDKEALFLRYGMDLRNNEVGQHLGITEDAAEKRVERALGRLCRNLGGFPPIWPSGRKAVSNSAARTRLRKEYGE